MRVRNRIASPDAHSQEPLPGISTWPSVFFVPGSRDECSCLCADSGDEFVCLREEQEGLNVQQSLGVWGVGGGKRGGYGEGHRMLAASGERADPVSQRESARERESEEEGQ